MSDRNFGWAVRDESGRIIPEFELRLPEKELKKRLRQRERDLKEAVAQAALCYYGVK